MDMCIIVRIFFEIYLFNFHFQRKSIVKLMEGLEQYKRIEKILSIIS